MLVNSGVALTRQLDQTLVDKIFADNASGKDTQWPEQDHRYHSTMHTVCTGAGVRGIHILTPTPKACLTHPLNNPPQLCALLFIQRLRTAVTRIFADQSM